MAHLGKMRKFRDCTVEAGAGFSGRAIPAFVL